MIARYEFIFRLKQDKKNFEEGNSFEARISDKDMKSDTGNTIYQKIYGKIYGIRIHFNRDLPDNFEFKHQHCSGMFRLGPRTAEIVNLYSEWTVSAGKWQPIEGREVICALSSFDTNSTMDIRIQPTSSGTFLINCLEIRKQLTNLKTLPCLEKIDLENIDRFLAAHNDYIEKMKNQFHIHISKPVLEAIDEGIQLTKPHGFFSKHLINEIFSYYNGEDKQEEESKKILNKLHNSSVLRTPTDPKNIPTTDHLSSASRSRCVIC